MPGDRGGHGGPPVRPAPLIGARISAQRPSHGQLQRWQSSALPPRWLRAWPRTRTSRAGTPHVTAAIAAIHRLMLGLAARRGNGTDSVCFPPALFWFGSSRWAHIDKMLMRDGPLAVPGFQPIPEVGWWAGGLAGRGCCCGVVGLCQHGADWSA